MRKVLIITGLLSLLLLTGCLDSKDTVIEPLGPEAWLPLQIGEIKLEAQIALTAAEQRKGLMHRDSIPEDGGMLFPYKEPRQMSFWMQNTRIPLDIGFFDKSGLLLEVHRMVPYDTTHTRSHAKDIQYALEMNSGWFARNGLYPGQRLDMTLLAEAFKKRGADPKAFGIEP